MADHTVNSLGGAEFTTIEAALASPLVVNGDRVIVTGGGPYTPPGHVVINKSITLMSDPALPVKPSIYTNYSSWTLCCIQMAAVGAVLDGFIIDNHLYGTRQGHLVGDYGGAIAGWTVRNCVLNNCRKGIVLIGQNNTITRNEIYNTYGDCIDATYGNPAGSTITYNILHAEHMSLKNKPAGVAYACGGAGGETTIAYNYCWACRTFLDFETSGSTNHTILVDHNTIDYWIGKTYPTDYADAQQNGILWWASGTDFDGSKFDIRNNIFTGLKWYAVSDTSGTWANQTTYRNNLFYHYYLRDDYWPAYQAAYEWPGARGAAGWWKTPTDFLFDHCVVGDPLYSKVGSTPDTYYNLTMGSPAAYAATDGLHIGAWQGYAPQPYTYIRVIPGFKNRLFSLSRFWPTPRA